MDENKLYNPVTSLKGIGEKSGSLFAKCGVMNINDLIHYYPRSYCSLEKPVSIDNTVENSVCSIRCIVKGGIKTIRIRNMYLTVMNVADTTGICKLTFFNEPYLKKTVRTGLFYVFRGRIYRKGKFLCMDQPGIYKSDDYLLMEDTMQPVYSLVKGLTNNAFIKAQRQAAEYIPNISDTLSKKLRIRYGLTDLQVALHDIHFPNCAEDQERARRRLAFDEFLNFILNLKRMKNSEEKEPNLNPMIEVSDTERLIEQLPYSLTKDQAAVWKEVKKDLTGKYVMNRLIQGDVGSGKTIIAFLALLMTAVNGCQGAIMAPTEVLAAQHYVNFMELVKTYRLPMHIILLTGSLSAAAKREAHDMIAAGSYDCIIGTSALIQDTVKYKKLALVITDEQHRFGVRQRENLAGKGFHSNVLAMSATPIPRTLAKIIYGDLEISILKSMPEGRVKIKNCVVDTNYRQTAYKFIFGEIQKKHQAYIICPMIEPGEQDGLENVIDYAAKLYEFFPPEIRIAIMHGKMKENQKNEIMKDFSDGNIDILVSTTVIEVGINVPNATVMMIENADRFGLAQLHQLRGRVGRGKDQSYCIFVRTASPKKSNDNNKTDRLEILCNSNDGFEIAEKDLKLRGPGELFGIRQSGELSFGMADIYGDADLLQLASEVAQEIMSEYKD